MLRKGLVVRLVALAAVIVVVGASVSEAQGRRQRGQRGNRFGGGAGGRFGRGSSLAILKNEYLQQELNFTAAQKKRVEEIDIQMAGISALQREDVQKALGITDAQKEKMKSVRDGMQEKMRGLFGSFRRPRGGQGGNRGERPNFDEIRKKMTELRESNEKEVLAVLTPTQVATFERMKGKKIDLEKLRPERRQRGRDGAPKRPEI